MQPHALQHTMQPNPSPRPTAGVLSLRVPTPRHARAPSFAGGGGSGGYAQLAGDVGYAAQEQVCLSRQRPHTHVMSNTKEGRDQTSLAGSL